MCWESSASADGSLLSMPWATPCTHPARPWRDSRETWFVSPWARERLSIRSPRQTESVNGSFSLPCPRDRQGLQCRRNNLPVPQPGWEVKAFCRSAAVWGPRPPASKKVTKFQPLRSIPSPSVKMGRKSRKRERSQEEGSLGTADSHSEGQWILEGQSRTVQRGPHLGKGRGKAPVPGESGEGTG